MPSNVGMAFVCEACGQINPSSELDPFAEQAGRFVCYECVDGYLAKGADQYRLPCFPAPRKLLSAGTSEKVG